MSQEVDRSEGQEQSNASSNIEEGAGESAEIQTSALVVADDDKLKFLTVKKGKRMLRQLEGVISRGIKDFWSVGEALIEIRAQQLYRQRYSGEDYKSFTDYLEDRWGYSRGYQMIKAAEVRRAMMEIGIRNPDRVCASERQYRENSDLLKIVAAPEKLEQFKEAIGKERRLSSEILGREIRRLLPKPPEKALRPASSKALDRKLARLKAKFEKELAALRSLYPGQAEKIDEWLRSFAAL